MYRVIKTIALFSLSIFMLNSLFADNNIDIKRSFKQESSIVIPVSASRNSIYNALVSANDGDILELIESEEYLLDSILTINKTITIRAAKSLDEKPILINDNAELLTRNFFVITDGGNLFLDGLELDGRADSDTPVKYAITNTAKMQQTYKLFVNDCILHDFIIGEEGRFLRTYEETYADSVVFTNSLLYNAGRQGICIKDTDNSVGYFEISHSTMFNVYHEGIYVQGDSVIFRVDHCTFDKLGYASMDMVRPRFIEDTQITNTIFSNVPAPQSRALLIYGPAVVDYCVFYDIGAVDVHNTAICQLGDSVYYDVDPQYMGREYGDFTLSPSSPFLTFSSDGLNCGDPNWSKYSGLLAKVIPVGIERNALYDSLQVAKDTDILQLSVEGEYWLDSVLVIDKEITIKAADALVNKPIIKNANIANETLMQIQSGACLRLKGLEIDGQANTDKAINTLLETANILEEPYKLIIQDCEFHDMNNAGEGSFFKASASSSADSLVVDDCIFYNCSDIGFDMIAADNIVDNFVITNTTMFDMDDAGFSLQGSFPVVRVDHCTFNNMGLAGNGMINPAVVDLDIKNSIFSNMPDTTKQLFTYYGYGEIDYCDMYKTGELNYWGVGEPDLGDSLKYNVDPMYADAENGDFTLLSESPLHWRGDDELSLGDLRWAKNAPKRIFKKFYVPAYQNSIYDSLIVANNRDTLILTEAANYTLDSLLRVNKNVIVRAAEGLETKPVLMNVNPNYDGTSIFQIETGGNLYLDGLDLDGIVNSATPGKYLIRTAETVEGLYNLFVNDCILHDVVYFDMGSFFRAYSNAFADTVKFTNCIMYNSGKEGIRIKDRDNTVKYFEMTNCTMYHTKTEAMYVQGSDVIFRLNHCTFDDIAWIHADMIRPRYVIDAEIKNCIFSNTPEPHSRVILLYGSSLMSHNDFYNVGGITKVVVHDSSSYRFGENMIFEVDPLYADADNGDFTLQQGSQLYGMADDGEAMGDLRWATNPPEESIGDAKVPEKYELTQNYPNPFNPVTTISFSMPATERMSLKLYDISGRFIATLLDRQVTAGKHELQLDASNLSSGIYFYRMESSSFNDVKKMTLLK